MWESLEGSNSNTGAFLVCGRMAPFLSEVVEVELFTDVHLLLCSWEMAPSHTGDWGSIWDSHYVFVALEWVDCLSAALQGLTKLKFPDCFPICPPCREIIHS